MVLGVVCGVVDGWEGGFLAVGVLAAFSAASMAFLELIHGGDVVMMECVFGVVAPAGAVGIFDDE